MSEHTAAEDWDDRTRGRRIRRVRNARRLSQRTVAGLAGISVGHLSEIENGKTALDSRKTTVALANALQISPSELMSLPIPPPADGATDSHVSSVRQALMAVTTDRPGGEVQPVEQLLHRAEEVESVDYEQRGQLLPALIRDLHTTLGQGRDMQRLLRIAALLYAQTVRGYFYIVGASLDLRWQATTLGRHAAGELNDPIILGFIAWATVIETLAGGAFDLARCELASVRVPMSTDHGRQMNGMLSLSQSLVAATDGNPGEVVAALEHATELAERTGQGDAFSLGFGPVNVGIWRMAANLEAGEPDETIRVAEGLRPTEHPSRERQATYWMDYGRALARVRRRDDAVWALHEGERLFPMRVLRNSFARDTLAELTAHVRPDSEAGKVLRGMAHRAGLPV